MENTQPEWVSKTRRKKEMHELQDLGIRLAHLSADTLKKTDLPEELREAIAEYGKIRSNGALKRQAQYIGRLMRGLDPAPIREFLDKLQGSHAAYNAFLQRVERTRETLLENDDALTAFLREYPAADAARLHTLIRNARKERGQAKPPKHFRALYRCLKETMEAAGSAANVPAAEGGAESERDKPSA